MGLLQGWLLLVSYPPAVSPLVLDGSTVSGTRWLLFVSSLAIGLALIGCLRYKALCFLAHPAFLSVGILLFVVGSGLTLLGNLAVATEALVLFCTGFGYIASGLGAAVLFIGWAGVLFRFDPKLMQVSVAFAFMIAFLLVIAVALLPLIFGAALLGVSFIFSSAALIPFSKETALIIPAQETKSQTKNIEQLKIDDVEKGGTQKDASVTAKPSAFMVGVAAMTLCYWAVFDYCKTVAQLPEVAGQDAFIPSMALGALAILILALLHLKSARLPRFCPTIAIMAACLGLLIMLVEPFGIPAVPIASAISFPLAFCVLVELWIMALKLAQRGVLPLAFSVTGFLAPAYIGMAVGSFCEPFLAGGFPFVRIVLLFALLCPSLVLQSFLNEKERRYLSPEDPSEPSNDLVESSALVDSHYQFNKVLAGLATQYRLSRREREILPLLAKGRDIVYIGEELVISKNTVITHTKNLYRKMGVHSKQELISLIEQAVEEAD